MGYLFRKYHFNMESSYTVLLGHKRPNDYIVLVGEVGELHSRVAFEMAVEVLHYID